MPHHSRPDENSAETALRGGADGGGVTGSTRRFVRHYVEMVIAMFLGMAVLMPPAGWALSAVDTSWFELHTSAPALMLLGMAVTMTVPMVGWMRYRGHGWRANLEMSASMLLPALAVMTLRELHPSSRGL
jgi:hypothetical protein